MRKPDRNHNCDANDIHGEHTRGSSFQFRTLLAVILFTILILFDKSNSKTTETAIENFSQAISADVEDKLELWVENNIKSKTE